MRPNITNETEHVCVGLRLACLHIKKKDLVHRQNIIITVGVGNTFEMF